MSNKKFVVTKYFDSYPTFPYCVCDTIEEARNNADPDTTIATVKIEWEE